MTQQAFATIEQVYHNPGDRILRVVTGLACNVADETIRANIAENSVAHPTGWVKRIPAHSGIAVLCGSGPSLADHVEDIRQLQRAGARVFAMNGAASFLWHQHKLMPDFQIIMDAKPETATLIGPALDHLFAAQVDPECFKRAPDARLWQATHGEWIPDFPDHPEDYCIIGGSISVGNTALALVYAMGYRDLRCFGYDSSHRAAEGHAFEQKMNDGDACTITEFGGREYVSSYAMKLQADTFISRAKQLEAEGCTISVVGDGLLPAMWTALKEPIAEREKYQRMWGHQQYRFFSPGEHAAARFLQIEQERGTVLDIGCGTGRGSIVLGAAGFDPVLVDFAANARDEEARKFPFSIVDISRDALPSAKFGFCTDVMEHLPPEDVDAALRNILGACERIFFTISTVPDHLGSLIGKDLHLSVHPYGWWVDKIDQVGGRIAYGENAGETAIFYVHSKI